MRSTVSNPLNQPAVSRPDARITPAASVEVMAAQARVRAAALTGDPPTMEAAARAYVTAVNLALLASFARVVRGTLRTTWRGIRGKGATRARAADLDR